MFDSVEMKSIPLPEIKGDGFSIRPYQEGDEQSLQKSLDDPEVTERLTKIPKPYTLEHAQKWIADSAQEVTSSSSRVNFGIIVGGEVAGSVAFIDVNMQQQNGQISVWIARRFWRLGLATKALTLLLKFGFEEMNLYRAFAYYVEDNAKSKKMLDRLGFQYEGHHRKEWKKFVDGQWVRFDSIHCSLLRPEWEERKMK